MASDDSSGLNTDGTDPDYVISKAWSLVSGGVDLIGYTIPTGSTNPVRFDTALVTVNGVGIPPDPYDFMGSSGDGTMSAPIGSIGGTGGGAAGTGLTLPGAPTTATFESTDETFTIKDLDATPQPTYKTAVITPAVPSPAYTAPDMDFPQVQGLSDFGEADLDFPSIPTLTPDALDTFSTIDLDPLSATIVYDNIALPDFTLSSALTLEALEPLTYDADSSFLSQATTAMQSGAVVDVNPLISAKTEDLHREVLRSKHEVRAESAERGFFMATGDVTHKLILLSQKHQQEVKKVAEEIREEAGSRALKVISAAGGAAIALEAKHLDLHFGYVENLMEQRQIMAKALAALVTQASQMYNAKLATLKYHVNVYETYVRTVNEINQAKVAVTKKAEGYIDTEMAKVQEYAAQKQTEAQNITLQAMKYEQNAHRWQEYATKLKNVKQNVDRLRLNIESLQAATKAYEQSTDYDAAAAKANRAALESWSSEYQVDSANKAIAGEFYSTDAERSRHYASQLHAASGAFNHATNAYQAYINAQRSYLSSISEKLDVVSRASSAFNAYSDATTRYTSAWNRAEGTRVAALNQQELVEAEQTMRGQVIAANEAAAQATIDVGRLVAQANTAASIAEAAYSTYGGQLSMRGTIDMQGSSSVSSSTSMNTDGQESYSRSTEYLL